MRRLGVLLCDDHFVVRMGLKALIEFEPDLVVVGEAASGEEAVRLCAQLKPDVVVMDLKMPKMDGTSATAAIKKTCPATQVLLLTSFGTAPEVVQALRAGATGALVKGATDVELLTAIRSAADGRRVVGDGIALRDVPDGGGLSDRNREVLALVAKGFSNAEIAAMLGISEDGVKNHLRTVFRVLGASNRAEAVMLAGSEGLLR